MGIHQSSRPGQAPRGSLRRVLGGLAAAALLVSVPFTAALGAQDGVASYYGKRFHGRRTASGDRFNMHALTAAHRKWGFGTRVRVTNKANGRSVVVRINDRGPYVRGRAIDLSYGAARRLGMTGSGIAKVRLERLGHAPMGGSGARLRPTLDDLF